MSKAIELAEILEKSPFFKTDLYDSKVASELRRLAAIEQKYLAIMAQEPFGKITYGIDSDNWPVNIEFIASHSSGADWFNLPSGSKLYTLPVSPAINETKYLLLSGKVRDALHLANYLMQPTANENDAAAYIEARNSVLKSLNKHD
ncbi:MAG: hypothetical protein ACRCUH_11710 [Shewanella sp.]